MSNIYITEPPTNGKVLIHTSVGDIDIELWSKETPKTCRNFVQLCLEGYYNGTIFHRVVPDFIVQGGDPTGTGTGGESIYGKPFRDEFHTRLRFARRGLVAMANAGANDNASQFFFTLGPTPELNKKHTIFGKVVGDTLYNMLKLSEVDIGPDERPTFPPKINKTKVLMNPYDDVVPRMIKPPEKSGDDTKKKSKSKATKNFSLLSFGEEAEEEEVEVKQVNKSMKSKSKSSHDLLHDSKLSSLPAVESKEHDKMLRKQKRQEQNLPELTDSSEDEDNIEASKERIKQKLRKNKKEAVPVVPKRKAPESDSADEDEATKSKSLEELKREAKKLKREILASRKKEKEPNSNNVEQKPESIAPQSTDAAVEGFKANVQLYKEQQKKRHKKGSDRESQTLALLAKFQSKMNTAQTFAVYDDDDKNEELEEGEEEEEDEDMNDLSWMRHQLKFDVTANAKKVMDANVTDTDRYEIFDPRNPMNQRKREASKQAMKAPKKKEDKL